MNFRFWLAMQKEIRLLLYENLFDSTRPVVNLFNIACLYCILIAVTVFCNLAIIITNHVSLIINRKSV